MTAAVGPCADGGEGVAWGRGAAKAGLQKFKLPAGYPTLASGMNVSTHGRIGRCGKPWSVRRACENVACYLQTPMEGVAHFFLPSSQVAPDRIVLVRFTAVRSALIRFAPLRSAPLRSVL